MTRWTFDACIIVRCSRSNPYGLDTVLAAIARWCLGHTHWSQIKYAAMLPGVKFSEIKSLVIHVRAGVVCLPDKATAQQSTQQDLMCKLNFTSSASSLRRALANRQKEQRDYALLQCSYQAYACSRRQRKIFESTDDGRPQYIKFRKAGEGSRKVRTLY